MTTGLIGNTWTVKVKFSGANLVAGSKSLCLWLFIHESDLYSIHSNRNLFTTLTTMCGAKVKNNLLFHGENNQENYRVIFNLCISLSSMKSGPICHRVTLDMSKSGASCHE